MKAGLPFSILIVEDDADDRLIIDLAFLEIDYDAEVKKFIDGKGLFKYLEDTDASLLPSLIVLNDNLPADGTELVLSALKQNPLHSSIPVVILTSGISNQKQQHLLSLGAYACLEKGNTMQEIIELVKELKNISQVTASNTGEKL